MADNTKRFSNRVGDYVKYRPGYPASIVKLLEEQMGLAKGGTIADIGSGTGISAVPFLEQGYLVKAVEPNTEMRAAAAHLLSSFSNFTSVNGTAEETNLPSASVDMIFCAQAFHWFDKEKCKPEFERILKADGNIVLVWNARSTRSAFQQAYEKMLYDTIAEYRFINHRNINEETIADFFFPRKMHTTLVDNAQLLDLEGLKGRLRSSSYCPKEGEKYEALMRELEELFGKYKKEDAIRFEYETQLFWC